MNVIAAVEREFAILALDTAVDQLTVGESVRIELDDGETTTASLASLLMQLEDAVHTNSGNGGGGGEAGSRPPMWLDPVSLFGEIDAEVGRYRRADTTTRAARVRAWAGAMHAKSEGELADAAGLAERWVSAARGLLNPNPPIPLRGWTCPQCLWSFTEQDDDLGERVRRPILEVDMNTGAARCISEECGARWEFTHLELLLDSVHAQTAHETLAVESWEEPSCPEEV